MAFADTQKLVVELDLKGNFQRQIADARKSISKLDVDVGRLQDNARRGLANFSRNVALIGVAATAGITAAVKTGIDDLAELEDAISSIDGAIATMGLTGQVTGKQIADWANDIESDIDAAFDDKAIAQSAATLIRYGKVAPKALRPALEVVADLAAKTGDIESASEILAKSLAAPERAAARLQRIGVILTDAQKEQIEAMVEAGDTAGAQAALLDAVADSTKGAAKAMAGPYRDALNKTNDAVEDARKALAIGFLPVIEKVAGKLSEIASDPKALAKIEEFGRGLAGGLDKLIGIAEKLPWDAIGTSLQIGGMGARAILEAFTSLPPWVQTAVITGWGLNKLTGGALGSIVGELGKGLIKGVLGMNAGVVNINAGVVNGPGGPAGKPPAGGVGVGGAVATAGGVVVLGITQGVLADMAGQIGGPIAKQVQTSVGSGPVNIIGPLDRLMRALSGDFRSELEVVQDLERQQLSKQAFQSSTLLALKGEQASRQNITNERLEAIRSQEAATAAKTAGVQAAVHNASAQDRAIAAANQQAAFSIRDKVATGTGQLLSAGQSHRAALAARMQAAEAAAREAGRQTAAAIRDKDLSVTTNVKVNTSVSVRETIHQQTTYKKYYTVAS